MKKNVVKKKVKEYWVTKYALAKGLYTIRGVKEEPYSDGASCIAEDKNNWMKFRGKLGRDCFETLEEAEVDARARARKKLLSLQKQVAKIEKLALVPNKAKGWKGRDK